MELKKLPHIEIEVAPLPGKKLPAAVNTLRKLDVKKVGLIAGGTAAVLTVVSVAGRYGIYRGAVAAELKRQLAPLHRKLDQLKAEPYAPCRAGAAEKRKDRRKLKKRKHPSGCFLFAIVTAPR